MRIRAEGLPGQTTINRLLASIVLIFLGVLPPLAIAQNGGRGPANDWPAVVESAKAEGKVVVSIPASAELRKRLEEGFTKRFPIQIEVVTGRGSAVVRRIAAEAKSGVSYFDLHIGGSSSAVSGLLDEKIVEPFEAFLVQPDVRDPKKWWGGHLWVDREGRFLYSALAYITESNWHNTELVKPGEIKSYEDLLNPKWMGKIGFLDPRSPGAGDSNWSFIWQAKGESYLKKLVDQDLVLGRDQRVLAENLAKGKIAILIGLTYYSYLPFIKAGLPIKPLPDFKEGTYATGGSGNIAVIKNLPHPNATKVFLNWLLGKEGQDLFSRALGQATRRLDVDTAWLRETGVIPAKDQMSLEDYLRVENQSEDKLDKVRAPAAKIAKSLLR